jgi:hypothetical protein
MSVPSKTCAVDRADNPRSLRLYACTLYAPRVGQIITAHAVEKLGLKEGQSTSFESVSAVRVESQ